MKFTFRSHTFRGHVLAQFLLKQIPQLFCMPLLSKLAAQNFFQIFLFSRRYSLLAFSI